MMILGYGLTDVAFATKKYISGIEFRKLLVALNICINVQEVCCPRQ